MFSLLLNHKLERHYTATCTTLADCVTYLEIKNEISSL